MTKEGVSGLTLEDLLPHRGNMLLIDEVLEADTSHAVTRTVISNSFPLLSEDGVGSLIMVELAAQTSGVCNGLDRIQSEGRDSGTMGWLVGIKRAHFHIDCIPLGGTVVTCAENTHSYENLREVVSVLYMDDIVIGELTLQLYRSDKKI